MARTATLPAWVLGAALATTIGASTLIGAALAPARPAAPAAPIVRYVTVTVPAPARPTVAAPVEAAPVEAAPVVDVSGLRDEIAQLAADLERAQRDSSTLQGLTQQQQQELVRAQTEIQSTSQQRAAEAQDLQTRIDALGSRVGAVEQLAEKLRTMVGLPASGGPAGGPAGATDPGGEPAAVAHAAIARTEARLAALQISLDEIDSRARARLASVAVPAAGPVTASEMAFAPYVPRGQPVFGPITSTFGGRGNPFAAPGAAGAEAEFHTGMDISVPQGTPVLVTGPGVVTIAGPAGAYGNLVAVDHGHGISTYYGHNSRVLVSVGQQVAAGQIIALSGSTGRSTGPHVHYEVRINGNPVNPAPYMQLP